MAAQQSFLNSAPGAVGNKRATMVSNNFLQSCLIAPIVGTLHEHMRTTGWPHFFFFPWLFE